MNSLVRCSVKCHVIFDLLTPWAVSSGRTGGPAADATVVRSPGGLPYLPGRSVKGLLREGCRQAEALGYLPAGTCQQLFGEWSFAANAASRYEVAAGQLSFSDARLPREYEDFARSKPEGAAWATAFVQSIAATALEESGLARDKTLRTFEVAVPMTLRATIECPTSGDAAVDWLEAIKVAASLVRAVGAHRNRGFGRAQLRIEEVGS